MPRILPYLQVDVLDMYIYTSNSGIKEIEDEAGKIIEYWRDMLEAEKTTDVAAILKTLPTLDDDDDDDRASMYEPMSKESVSAGMRPHFQKLAIKCACLKVKREELIATLNALSNMCRTGKSTMIDICNGCSISLLDLAEEWNKYHPEERSIIFYVEL